MDLALPGDGLSSARLSGPASCVPDGEWRRPATGGDNGTSLDRAWQQKRPPRLEQPLGPSAIKGRGWTAAATGRSAANPREAGSAPPPPPCPAVRPDAATAVREGALHVPGARGPQLALLRGHARAAGQTATALALVSKYQAASSCWEPSMTVLRE